MSLKVGLRKLLPRWIFGFYHLLWAVLANIIYRWPSRHLIIIGVTGTKGKSTVSAMITHALNTLGQSCGLLSTATIKIGEQQWLNDLKMTMPGRLKMQKYLSQMVSAGHNYAVVETSSEAIVQWRHFGINYDAAVFTNLTPEHIESHGSFENYKNAKLKLWQVLSKSSKKNLMGKQVEKVSVVNIDDKSAADFLKFNISKTLIYGVDIKIHLPGVQEVSAHEVQTSANKISFTIENVNFSLPIGGLFNVYNALAATALLRGENYSLEQIANALKSFQGAPGRLEYIKAGQEFNVVVDYAHTAESLEAVYKTLAGDNKNLIAVLGSCGGGRDKDKRPRLGELAARYAKKVIITNEDPYDEDPITIMKEVMSGALAHGKVLNDNLFLIADRRQAIAEAFKSAASADDVVIITGKGSEQWLVTAQGKVPWDDRTVAKEELKKII